MDRELGLVGAGTFGGNTSCVEIDVDGAGRVICDAGSGIRHLGRDAASWAAGPAGAVYPIFLSHLHWDHIVGFPFFAPAYVPGNVVRIHGCHPVDVVREALRLQQSAPFFPVDFERLPATLEFVGMEPGRPIRIGGLEVSALRQRHPGESYAYRFEARGKAVVYATDTEHRPESVGPENPAVAFFRGADAVIFDTMYSSTHSVSIKEDWGHSSAAVGIELCRLAGARRLLLFHHEPALDDSTLATVFEEARRYEADTRRGAALEVLAAYDGLELAI